MQKDALFMPDDTKNQPVGACQKSLDSLRNVWYTISINRGLYCTAIQQLMQTGYSIVEKGDFLCAES